MQCYSAYMLDISVQMCRPRCSDLVGNAFLWHGFSSLMRFPSEYRLPNYAESSRAPRTRTWIAMRPSYTYFLPVTPGINLFLFHPMRGNQGLVHYQTMAGLFASVYFSDSTFIWHMTEAGGGKYNVMVSVTLLMTWHARWVQHIFVNMTRTRCNDHSAF